MLSLPELILGSVFADELYSTAQRAARRRRLFWLRTPRVTESLQSRRPLEQQIASPVQITTVICALPGQAVLEQLRNSRGEPPRLPIVPHAAAELAVDDQRR
jgi:hypothetical protein